MTHTDFSQLESKIDSFNQKIISQVTDRDRARAQNDFVITSRKDGIDFHNQDFFVNIRETLDIHSNKYLLYVAKYGYWDSDDTQRLRASTQLQPLFDEVFKIYQQQITEIYELD